MKIFGWKFPNMSLGTGIAVGAGVVILGPIVIPAVGKALRALTKEVIKGGFVAYEGYKGFVAETKETFEDLAAEAKAEVKDAAKAAPVAAIPAIADSAKEPKASAAKKKPEAKDPK